MSLTRAVAPTAPSKSRILHTALAAFLTATAMPVAGQAAETKKAAPAPKTKAEPKSTSASSSTQLKPGGILSAPPPKVKKGEGPGNTIVYLGAGFRSDLGSFSRKTIVGRAAVQDELMDVKQLAPVLHAGFLAHLAGSFRWGVGFGYSFNYVLTERVDGDNEPEEFEMGQYLTVDLRAEWSKQLGGPVWLTATPIVGLAMVLPGGGLKETMTTLKESHSIRTGPQFGFVGGAELGVRYQYNDYLSFKGAGGFQYTLQSLLSASREGDAADSDWSWSATASRISANIAAEASF